MNDVQPLIKPDDIPRRTFRQFLLTILFNSIIGLILTGLGGVFTINMVISQCIGLSIFSLHALALSSGFFNSRLQHLLMTIIAIVLGATLGTYIALHVLEWFFGLKLDFGNHQYFNTLLLGLFFGTIISYFFYSRFRILQMEFQSKAEQLVRMQKEKELTEAQFKLFQAQIEPHFLFNTLANIGSLIEASPARAKGMLDSLNQYLRVSLRRTRDEVTNLGQELELLEAYLSILKQRMQQRLDYRIECNKELHALRFPPLLIQPLIENAIKHGLEPKIEGGGIELSIKESEQGLSIQVDDNGVGFKDAWRPGVGLDNVYQRVKNLYGEDARFEVMSNMQGGVSSFIFIPKQYLVSIDESIRS